MKEPEDELYHSREQHNQGQHIQGKYPISSLDSLAHVKLTDKTPEFWPHQENRHLCQLLARKADIHVSIDKPPHIAHFSIQNLGGFVWGV